MTPPQPLLDRLAEVPGMQRGCRRLVLLFSQLGDFDPWSMPRRWCQHSPLWIGPAFGCWPSASGIQLLPSVLRPSPASPRSAAGGERRAVHRACGLYEGLATGAGAGLICCSCVPGSPPGTLAEVFRGYSGDRTAAQRFDSPLFRLAGRWIPETFELATVRLNNMIEVLAAGAGMCPTIAGCASAAAPFCSRRTIPCWRASRSRHPLPPNDESTSSVSGSLSG